ncbi:unnamed protein product [Effrenium voratum]|nr:unnamed protein product [Effrenium voratum]
MRRKFGDRAKTVSVHWTGSQALRHVHILRRARQIRSILKLGSRQSVGIKLSAAKMRACRAGMEQLLGLRLEAIEDMLLGLSSQGLGNFRSKRREKVLAEEPLVTHRVEEEDMFRLHEAFAKTK